MTAEARSRIIHEQSVIVEFCGEDAITTLADILRDPVDRYRALNLVMEVAGPMELLDAPTIAMFKRFQATLLTLAREWRDPSLDHHAQETADEAPPADADHASPQTESVTAASVDGPQDSAA